MSPLIVDSVEWPCVAGCQEGLIGEPGNPTGAPCPECSGAGVQVRRVIRNKARVSDELEFHVSAYVDDEGSGWSYRDAIDAVLVASEGVA